MWRRGRRGRGGGVDHKNGVGQHPHGRSPRRLREIEVGRTVGGVEGCVMGDRARAVVELPQVDQVVRVGLHVTLEALCDGGGVEHGVLLKDAGLVDEAVVGAGRGIGAYKPRLPEAKRQRAARPPRRWCCCWAG